MKLLLSISQTPIMLRTARAFLFKKMEKRYVLTLKQRPDGTYEVKLDNGLNAIISDRIPHEFVNIFESSEIGLVRFMIDSFYSANFKEICVSEPKEHEAVKIASEENSQRSSNDIELRKEIVKLLSAGVADSDFIYRVDSIYNWIKEGKL
jgi:hypothetical protein